MQIKIPGATGPVNDMLTIGDLIHDDTTGFALSIVEENLLSSALKMSMTSLTVPNLFLPHLIFQHLD